METIKVESPANIAFIKYWGQKNHQLVLPNNDSFSMNLSGCKTQVTFEKQTDKKARKLLIKNYQSKEYILASDGEMIKVNDFYDTAKKYLHTDQDFGFTISSENSFPKKAGIASSAAFFSALALAFSLAWGKKLTKKQLSILARLSGSGSACRSIGDGFNWWEKGEDSDSSYAQSIASPQYWDLVDLVAILSKEEKKIGSQEGHKNVFSSPFYQFRLQDVVRRSKAITQAFIKKDFTHFGELMEEEALSMHFVMMTQQPPLYYWSGKTIELIKQLLILRNKGIEAYYTIDAGENLHLICEQKSLLKVKSFLDTNKDVQDIIINYPTEGTKLL